MPPNGEALITPARGGKLTFDRVTVEFPAGAVDRDMTLRIVVKDPPVSPKYARFKYAFDLEGRAGPGLQGSPVTRFRLQPKVIIDTNGLGLSEEEQKRNLVWHYDEAERRWKPLTLLARPTPGVVALETHHFSSFAMGPTSDPIPPAPPGLEGYQTDLLTGTPRTVYTIEVPPGMGGLTPKLEIPYSTVTLDEMNRSHAMNGNPDNMDFSQQASVVGLGFDFEPGCIVAPTADGPRYLRVGGRSSRIIQNQSDGSWRTEDDWFWKVLLITPSMQDPNGPYPKGDGAQYWLAWDKDGTEYRFGFKLHSNHTIGGGYEYRYDLDRIRDVRNNYIEYIWDETTDNESGSYDSDRDYWLTEIRYTGNTAHSISPQRSIVFNWESRSDYIERADYDQPPNYVHRKRLASIEVFGDLDHNSSNRVSKHVFSYTYDTPYWHGFNEQGADVQTQALSKLLLLSITRYGADGANHLPATSFTYYTSTDTQIDGWKPKPWLKTATNGYGGKATYVYDYFTPTNFQYQWLKFRARLSSRKWEDLGITGNEAVEVTYDYGDSYDFKETWNHAPRAEFRGHDWVREIDSLGHFTRSWFYTLRTGAGTQNGKSADDVHILRGRMWQQARYDSNGTLLAYDTMDWDRYVTGTASDGSNTYFMKLMAQESHLGNKYKKVGFVYDDTYGNTLREYYNNSITGAPTKTVRRAFYIDTDRWIIGKVSWERVFSGIVDVADASLPSTWAKFTAWGYSSSQDVFHTAAQITNGLVYKVRNYFKDANQQEQSILTKYGYDDYGNRNSMTDPNACATNPNGNPTTFEYDSTYHAFLTKTTYPISSLYEERGYDLVRGLLTSINDSNNGANNDTRTLFAYDNYGRIVAIARPGDSLTLTNGKYSQATKGFVYYDSNSPFAVLTSTRKVESGDPNGSGYHNALYYYDGLGREVQRTVDYDRGANPKVVVVNTYYDSRGLKRRETIPHIVSTSTAAFLQSDWTDWATQDTDTPGTDYSYDPLRRPTSISNPDSTQRSMSYNDWDVTLMDENGHKKVQRIDALGRTTSIEEYTGAGSYTLYATTSYSYNILDNLTGVKDAVDTTPSTTITYDELSRKTQMVDPDMGTWTYSYDAAGNLVSQADAKGTTITFAYDTLSRAIRKHYPMQWVDSTLTTDHTVGVFDLMEIRATIDVNRLAAGLTPNPYNWSDPAIVPGKDVTIRATHFNEMRSAVGDLWTAASISSFPGFTRGSIPGNPVRTISLQDPTDLRNWLSATTASTPTPRAATTPATRSGVAPRCGTPPATPAGRTTSEAVSSRKRSG